MRAVIFLVVSLACTPALAQTDFACQPGPSCPQYEAAADHAPTLPWLAKATAPLENTLTIRLHNTARKCAEELKQIA